MRILKVIYFIPLLLLSWSCHETEIIESNSDIEKAKSWFELNKANLSKSAINSSARGLSDIDKTPDWSKYKIHTYKSGMKTVEVALDYETYVIPSETEPESLMPNVINSMLLFEVTSSEYEIFILKTYPDNLDTELSKEDFEKLNYGEIPSGFSGRMMFFDWNESFIGGWRITNGEKTKYIARIQGYHDTNGRVAQTEQILCYQITTYWYQIACVPSTGSCSDPVLIDATSVIECEEIIAPPDPSDPGSGGGDVGGDCYEPHPFIEGLMVPCEVEEPCENGYLRDINGDCYCPSSAMEVINGKCTFKCPTGYKRNESGYCVQIQNCATDDAIINAIQASLENLWKASNASHTSLPMSSRLENGGWIVNGPNGYSFIPFPSTWIKTPCGINPPASWVNDIPQGLVAWIHTHPFYLGEDVSTICEEENGVYQGKPSVDDAWLLTELAAKISPAIKGYIIDGNGIRVFDVLYLYNQQYQSKVRCGY